jgi:hypothetical protein
MNPTKTTPCPLALPLITYHEAGGVYEIVSADHVAIAGRMDRDTAHALVTAANALPGLVEACKMLLRWVELENQDAPEVEELTLLTVTEHAESALRKAGAL